MELIADGVLILAALAATAYCMVLSRRLRRLTEMDGGLGQAISTLSREVDHLTSALAEAKTATTNSATDLGAQCRAANAAARRLESLVSSANGAALQKHKDTAPDARTPPPVKTARVDQKDDVASKPAQTRGRRKQTPAKSSQAASSTKLAAPKNSTEPAQVSPPQPEINAKALDDFIGKIMGKDDSDNAALARRLVMALAAEKPEASS